MKLSIPIAIALAVLATVAAQQQTKLPDQGFTDTPILPGLKWHVHDPDRPYPPVVTPGATPGAPPSDAIVLYDGEDLSKWAQHGPKGTVIEPKWKSQNGYFEVLPHSGDMFTREKFGDCQ